MMQTPVKKHLPRHEKLFFYYKNIFKDNIPSWLLPARGVDYEISIEASEKIPDGSLFQLSSPNLVATKNFIADVLKN